MVRREGREGRADRSVAKRRKVISRIVVIIIGYERNYAVTVTAAVPIPTPTSASNDIVIK